jgi:hypothetical protein
MICPVPFETLVALWAGDLPDSEASAIEEHLFSCESCANAAQRLARVMEALGESVPPVISAAHRDRLAAAGLKLLHTTCEANGEATARFSDNDLMIHVLRGELTDAERVDVELIAGGDVIIVVENVPFARESGEVLIACQRHYEHAFGPAGADPRFRLWAQRGTERRKVGDYHVIHIWR